MFSYHDNKQPDNHGSKLPEACFMVIRLFRYFIVSGSVARSRGKHSAVFRRAATITERGGKHNIWWLQQLTAPLHLVSAGRAAPEGSEKIRNSGFSDLERNERGQALL